ncbi:Sel1-like repeat [Candidatus Pelagibacterales bacterium]
MTKDYFTLLKKAEKGDCDAQFNVGHYYYRLREFKKAYSWWLKCTKHNKRLGPIFNIGNLYYNGWGLKQNIKKAFYYFNLVIKKAPILYPKENIIYTQLALFLIGKTYFDGTFIKRNKTKGLNYYQKAAKLGSINAAYILSSIYGNKENDDYDFDKYIYYLKKTAQAGLSIAHAELAFIYSKKNKKLFYKHYKEAMKKDKKIIDKLELTSLATGGLISITKNYREALRKIYKENK